MESIIKVDNICKSFSGVEVLHNVCLEFRIGEIHALVGENGAGKTTLMRVICGIYQPDKGELYLENEKVSFENIRKSQEKGISIIHQELNMPVNLTIGEYLYLGRMKDNAKYGFVNRNLLNEKSKKLLDVVEVDRSASTKILDLTVAEQQLIEIAKALSLDSKLIIMDEPTSALNDQEVKNLFKIINNLKRQGVTIIYISHKLDELFEISDRITVMRDGCIIETKDIKDTSHEMIVKLMTGKDIGEDYYVTKTKNIASHKNEEPIFSVKNISSNKRNLNGVSFDLYKGEILGIAGLMGAGRTELMNAIFGADKKTHGEIKLLGETINIRNTKDAVKAGIMLVPEDRKTGGLILQMSIQDNINIPSLKKLSKWNFVNSNKGKRMADENIKKLRIKCRGRNQVVSTLSGGNQQKVVFAKWLAANPKILLLDDPTRGVDVGTKHEIYELTRELANQGIGVIYTSSEMPELLGVCDRVLVMRNGNFVGQFTGDEIDENVIMMHATGK